jgi:hypothetical protein
MIIATHGIVASQLAGFDADAQAFFDRVTTAGGSLSATEKTAVNKLVLDLKGYSIWTKMKAIYPMVGASAAACAQNLKSSSFTGTFSSGWTFASTGVTGNGTSTYFDSNLQVSTNLSETSTTLAIYSRTNNVVSAWDIGCRNFGYNNPMGILGNFTNTTYAVWNDYNATTSGVNTAASFILTKNSSTVKLFRNSSSVITGTKTLAVLPTAKILVGAAQDASANQYGSFSNRQYAYASIGDGLNDSEAGNLYTAIQAFQTTLARQV